MEYFKRLQDLLRIEKEEDQRTTKLLTETLGTADRRAAGITWYPVAIRDTEVGYGDYLSVELERTTHYEVIHQFRFGMTAALFSNHDAKRDWLEGIVSYVSGNRLKINLRTDELPDWARDGKLGVDAVFDAASYAEMEKALKSAAIVLEKKEEGVLANILIGNRKPSFGDRAVLPNPKLNASQAAAVKKITEAGELAIVHGPPGTGKTTTLVQAIKALREGERQRILVVAPSNTAVDLLSEKLSDEGLNLVRVGNPARVSERQLVLTLDSRVAAHSSNKEIKRLKKQASEYRDLAQKYKRSFGAADREQRKALFAEARNIAKEVERTENYIIDDILAKADIITATLVGANHYSVRSLQYGTVVIDEAGQALEPACWIPILKAKKLVMAGDHQQLPPTIKSVEAARGGLAQTLLEKSIALHPEAVVLLEEQYRMNETIARFSSTEFYEGRLRADSSVANHVLFEGDAPLLFIDTAGCGYEEVMEGTRISNPEEGQFLLKQVAALVAQLRLHYAVEDFPGIGVISPYKHQVEILKEAVLHFPELQGLGNSLSINTIDSFQGQERDAMFISLTRSNPESTIGFLSELRRMNVAMTRARKKLVVVGDSATLSQSNFYNDFISYAQGVGGYTSAWELMEL
jgi:superfamily I DNA and/or RNA helicase